MIFFNNGQTMVVASAANHRLFFYTFSNQSEYTMTSKILLNYTLPHGLYRANDSLFDAISWANPSLYAYSSHITVDHCNRRWLTLFNYGIRIYDERGIQQGGWLLGGGYFDTLRLDNYVVILSNLDHSKITRINPQLQCDDN